MERQLGISGADPKRDATIFATQPANWHFSSGSDLTEKEYLLLRVIWNHRENISEFHTYMRNSSALNVEDNTPSLYKGYVSPENDDLAKQIYQELAPKFRGYLEDIYSNTDGTRPSAGCDLFLPARHWQGLVMSRIKKVHTEAEAAAMPSKVWKTGDDPVGASPSDGGGDNDDDGKGGDGSGDGGASTATTSMAKMSISDTPKTPVKQGARAQHQMETPAVPRSYPAAGGMQNPATTDENYVNTALLLLLQMVTYYIRELTVASDGRLDFRGLDFGALDWLADRLALKLYRRQPGIGPATLMEARLDGYLCKRSSQPGSGGPLFNDLPLAIVEAKACVRSAGGSAIRWQESAEMACWVSSLAEESENYGLLQSSASGRKRSVYTPPPRPPPDTGPVQDSCFVRRAANVDAQFPRRLLLSQNRHEIYIIIAEYGEPWKQYVRTGSSVAQPTARTKDDAADLSGSEAFVWNSAFATHGEFHRMVRRAAAHLPPPEARQAQSRKLLDPDHFCFMHQWGPFRLDKSHEMDLFLRRLIALQVELLSRASTVPA
jgi:hypothetical protein